MINYFDISDDQFESVVVSLGHCLFGVGLSGFAKGPDGGRDAKFTGTANEFPSKSEPWTGCTIIQVKHTNGINASFSDNNFFNPNKGTGILCDEIPKIKALFKSGELDNYLLISNRKLTANAQAKMVDYISKETGLAKENIHIAGIENLDDWFESFPNAKNSLNINPLETPVIFNPDELAKVVEEFADVFKKLDSVDTRSVPVPRTSYEDKVRLNKMTEEFAKNLRNRFLSYTPKIQSFLSDPSNSIFQESYEEAVEEFSLKLSALQAEESVFDNIYNHLTDILCNRSSILRSNKKLTRAMLFYMYYHCDIGRNND